MFPEPKFLPSFSAIDLRASTPNALLHEIADMGTRAMLVKASWAKAVLLREREFPTGLPTPIPVAIPHTDSVHVITDGIGFFRAIKPIKFGEMGATDQFVDVQIIIPLLISNHEEQVNLLMKVITAVQDEKFVAKLLVATDLLEIAALFSEKEL